MAKVVVNHFTEGVEETEKLIAASNDLVLRLQELIDTVLSVADSTNAKINSLSYEKIDYEGWDKELQRDLKNALLKVTAYACKVNDLYQYGCDKARLEKIRQELKDHNPTELTNFIRQLQIRLSKCEESYQEAQEVVNELISNSQKAAGFCEKKALEANTNMKTVELVLAVVGGVAVSAFATTFSIGAGAIVGLGVTAAFAIVFCEKAARKAGIALYLLPNFEEVEKQYKQLERSFSRTLSDASRIEEDIKIFKMWLESIAYAVEIADSVKIHSEQVESFECLCRVFDQSEEAFKIQEKVKNMHSKMQAMFNEDVNTSL